MIIVMAISIVLTLILGYNIFHIDKEVINLKTKVNNYAIHIGEYTVAQDRAIEQLKQNNTKLEDYATSLEFKIVTLGTAIELLKVPKNPKLKTAKLQKEQNLKK